MVIPQISDKMRKRIKKIVKFHYGFDPQDRDIDWIDDVLRNNYSTLHDQRIIRNLVTMEIHKILLKHRDKKRDKIGSIKFEKILLHKLIFHYLTFASMSYRAGIPFATISLCRTAIEAGLRERVAEELAKKEISRNEQFPKKVLEKMETLKDLSLGTIKTEKREIKGLIKLAEENNIISNEVIQEVFKKLKFKYQNSRKILDKFIHGDLIWIVNFVKEKGKNSEVIGAENILEKSKIIADFNIDDIAVEVLKATTKIAELLYFKNG